MALQQIRIIGESLERMRALERYDLDLKHRAGRRLESGEFQVPALASDEMVDTLERDGYRVERIHDLDRVAPERLAEVSRANRFADARGIEDYAARTVLGYMTTAEIDSALGTLAASHPGIVTVITLPHTTIEGRTCRAIRIRAGTQVDRAGVLFTGAMHAREWGGSDISIHFAVTMLQAYTANTGATYGAKTFSVAQVRAALESLDVFVFPNVNPDGKVFSQTNDPTAFPTQQNLWWRKNRNPNTGAARGVDVNRNFDFLWSSGIGTSASTSSNTYRGTGAFSEPESRNVRYLFDTYPSIRYYVDIHSFGELLLYSWGDDENQATGLTQRFTNAAFNGVRGVVGDSAYREFIAAADEQTAINLARRMHDAIQAVRGRSYTVQQAVGLYPTSGTSDDYAFSRHVVTPSRNKVYAYTIEFGQEFVPPHAEMLNVMNEIAAGMTEFCWATLSDLLIRDNVADTGATPSTGPFWNSPDVWVRNNEDGVAVHQNTVRGRDNFVYVQVQNRGIADARDVRVRVSLSSFAGTEFIYPEDWIPQNPGGGGSISTPGTYWIGESVIPLLAAGAQAVTHVRWPSALIPPDTGWHPCLLVDLAPNDGRAPGGREVRHHNNLGQKNITIVTARRRDIVEFRFVAGSAFSAHAKSTLVVRALKAPLKTELIVGRRPLGNVISPHTLPAVTLPEFLSRPVVMTLMTPSLVSVGSDRPVHMRLPARTRIESGGLALAGAAPAESSRAPLEAGAVTSFVPTAALALTARKPEARVPFDVDPKLTPETHLKVQIPASAKMGQIFEFEVVQEYANGQIAGGVVLQIKIV